MQNEKTTVLLFLWLAVFLCLIVLPGCADSDIQLQKADLTNDQPPPPPPIDNKNIFPNYGEHPFCSNIKFASDDFLHYKNAYRYEYYTIAQESFVFAWMASNVYEEFEEMKPEFKFENWTQLGDKIHTWRGLGAHIYMSDDEERIVIAYEGTNFKSARDWFFGNFNIFWRGQYGEALDLARQVADLYPDAELITTGHSLGGGLAIHVALRMNGVTTYAFNSSPRVFAPRNPENPDSRLVLISENKDVLKKIRTAWKTLENYQEYDQFDFLNSDSVTEHSIYYFGRGLTTIAASTGDWEYENIALGVLQDEYGNMREPVVCPM